MTGARPTLYPGWHGFTHECPADGCTVPLPHRVLMCASHWRMVPRALQYRVNSSWRGRSAEVYLDVRQEAIDAVNKKVRGA